MEDIDYLVTDKKPDMMLDEKL